MIDDNVSVGDLRTFFQSQVCMYKNKPVMVKVISDRKQFMMLDLLTQKTFQVENPIKDIEPPVRRLGMVNYDGACVYLVRQPYRNMQMGINTANTKVQTITGMFYPTGRSHVQAMISMFDKIEVGLCLINKYPSFSESIAHLGKYNGSIAFDKQFAIGLQEEEADYTVFYKNAPAGTVKKTAASVEQIKWGKGNEYLLSLLEAHREKDF